MIRSMTGFSNERAEIDGWIVGWEIFSVNHRFLDISLHLPDGVKFGEPQFRAAVASVIKRGKVNLTLSCNKNDADSAELIVDHSKLKQLVSSLQEIEKILESPKAYTPFDLMSWPGVFVEPKPDWKHLSNDVLELLQRTLDKLITNREREGQKLSEIIEERCTLLGVKVLAARDRMPTVLRSIRDKLVARLADITDSLDSDRLEEEMVFIIQKLDVAEELDRLESHIAEVRGILNDPGPIGRRLDFFMQELNREANTLGSKSADTKITQISIDMKVLIEQMREQAQNIE